MKVEFRSQLEQQMPAEELRFEATPGFGTYRRFLEHGISHPAKMNTKLLRFLIMEFTKQDETVLDPMCGSGSMGVVAALHGRNAVQVDIESKFIGWAEQARMKVEAQNVLGAKGKIRNICGDSRKLGELLGEIDVIVTSPPYSGSITGNLPKQERRAKRMREAGYDPKTVLGGHARVAQIEWRYADRGKKANIGNLSHGNIDAVVTSPPYSEGIGHNRGKATQLQTEKKLHLHGRGSYSENLDNIGNLSHGNIDAIVTSPPYADSQTEVDGEKGCRGGDSKQRVKKNYAGVSEGNIGHFPHVPKKQSESYLQAMFKVYSEMWKVLKPSGFCIIVIKPFIRHKKVVDLPLQTWLLLERAGFKLVKLYKLHLLNQSFWRILYIKKFPNVPVIEHEYVLVTRK